MVGVVGRGLRSGFCGIDFDGLGSGSLMLFFFF